MGAVMLSAVLLIIMPSVVSIRGMSGSLFVLIWQTNFLKDQNDIMTLGIMTFSKPKNDNTQCSCDDCCYAEFLLC
jgi:hypothetical protein